MELSPVTTSSTLNTTPTHEASSMQRRLLDDQANFASVLSRASEDTSESANPTRDAAEKLISVAFVQPVLAKMRESSNAAPPFQPNQAEKSFRGMMDAALSQKIVKSTRWALVDRIEERLRGRGTTSAMDALRAQSDENAAVDAGNLRATSEGAETARRNT